MLRVRERAPIPSSFVVFTFRFTFESIKEFGGASKINLKKLHTQRKSSKPHKIFSLCWNFYCVNDNVKIDLENTHIMHCILYYQELVIGINLRIQTRKRLISYYKTNGITSLKKHVDVKHTIITKLFKEKIFVKRNRRKIISKERLCLVGQFLNYFLSKLLKKKDVSQKEFLEDPSLLIVKNNLPI